MDMSMTVSLEDHAWSAQNMTDWDFQALDPIDFDKILLATSDELSCVTSLLPESSVVPVPVLESEPALAVALVPIPICRRRYVRPRPATGPGPRPSPQRPRPRTLALAREASAVAVAVATGETDSDSDSNKSKTDVRCLKRSLDVVSKSLDKMHDVAEQHQARLIRQRYMIDELKKEAGSLEQRQKATDALLCKFIKSVLYDNRSV